MKRPRPLSVVCFIVSIAIVCMTLLVSIKRGRKSCSPCDEINGKKVNLVPGIGIPGFCEVGMRIPTMLQRIGSYAFFHDVDRSLDVYVKYAWGLQIMVETIDSHDKVDTLLFDVQPIDWGLTNENSCLPDFSTWQNLFRGTIDNDLDFSNGNVTIDAVKSRYGECEMSHRQGEPCTTLVMEKSCVFLSIDDEVLFLRYPSRGIQFGFMNGFVQDIVIFKPQDTNGD